MPFKYHSSFVPTVAGNPLKESMRREERRLLHGGLFEETRIFQPSFNQKMGVTEVLIGLPRYRLVPKRYRDLLQLLILRNKLSRLKFGKHPVSVNRISKNEVTIYKKLREEFGYDLLVKEQVGTPGAAIIPFFDLRFVLARKDLEKWAKVVELELERYSQEPAAGRGRPAKFDAPDLRRRYKEYLLLFQKKTCENQTVQCRGCST